MYECINKMQCIVHFIIIMREAGFEPANPKDVGLSDAALTTNRFARNTIGAPCGTRTRDHGLIRPIF